MNLCAHDRDVLRSLAGAVREIAGLPAMEDRRRLWYRHNDLDPERPLVLCNPEGAWDELLPEGVLVCRDDIARDWEWDLRSKIFWWEHIRDDNVVEPWIGIPWRIAPGDFGVQAQYTSGANRGSYRWDPPIRDLPGDLARLRPRRPGVDRAGTQERLAAAAECFGDLLPPRIRGHHHYPAGPARRAMIYRTPSPPSDGWWTVGLTWDAIKLVGLENFMLAMLDNPAGLHALMGWLRDECRGFIEWHEAEQLLTPANRNDYTGSGGIGYTRHLPQPGRGPGDPVRLTDLWGLAEAQETVGVSPAMFAEFVLPYQLPLLAKFGLTCYGCCEPLHDRVEQLLRIPNLRRVSASAWCKLDVLAERLGGRCVLSRKPNPATVCVSFDEAVIRRDLRDALRIAGRLSLEIILKDTHTVQSDPTRLTRWVALAREEITRFA